jgi:restriction system protein
VKSSWKDYQEATATFFRALGLSAETDVRLMGVRTAHDIDVVVKSVHVGFEVTWLVECKLWKTPVSKLHVLGLRQIVLDLGADRGILLSESGFQSGAIEAATLTNVQLTSLAQLSESTKLEIFAMRLRELFDRLENCRERYWAISKADRIRTGLRPQVGNSGYSGIAIIDYCQDLLSQTMRSRYPINLDSVPVYVYSHLAREFSDVSEAVPILEQHIGELEIKLANAVKQSATPTC